MAMSGMPSAVGYSESDKAMANVKQGAEDSVRLARSMLAADVDKCMAGDLYSLIEQTLQARFETQTFMAMALQSGISTRLNLMRHVVDKVAVEWLEGARFFLIGQDEENEYLKRHMEHVQMNALMRRITRLWWVHPAVLAWACVMDDDKKGDTEGATREFVTRIITPRDFDVEVCACNPGDYDAVNLYDYVPADRCSHKRTRWTDEKVETFERKDNGEPWIKTGETPNPYGTIPGVLFRPDPFKCWADNYGKQLLEATIDVNCAKTLASHMMGAQVKVLVGAFTKAPSKQTLRQAALIDSGGEQFQLVDLQTNVDAFRNAFITSEFQELAMQLNINMEEFGGTSTPPSGEALKMRNAARDRAAMERQPYAIEQCRELYWKQLQVLAVCLADGGPPIEGYEDGNLPPFKPLTPANQQPVQLGIEVFPIEYPELAVERAADDDRRLRLGLTNRAELYVAAHPDVELGEAADLVKANVVLEAGLTSPTAALSMKRSAGAPAQPVPAAKPGAKQDALGKVDAGTNADTTLNGAQITAALEVMTLLGQGTISHVTAVALLVAVGIERSEAEKMAKSQDSLPPPDAAAAQQVVQSAPAKESAPPKK